MANVLTAGRPWKVIIVFAIPLLVGNVVQQLYQVTDAFVVGRTLGVDALAAVGSTGSLLFLLLGFAWGLTSGFAIPTAQAFGARDQPAVRRSVATSVLLTTAVSVVLTVVAVAATGPALELLQTPDELMPQARTFATVSFAGAIATMFYNYLASAVRAIGDSRTPLVFLAVCCVLNVVLVVAFVNFLGLGVGGAAAATVASQAVSVVLCLEYVRRRVPALHISRADLRVRRADVLHHLRLGLPMGFQASIIAIGALAVQTRLNGLGPDAVAAFTTGARVDGLAVTLLASLGLAVSTFAAQNHGGGRPDRIRTGVVHGAVMAVGGSIVIGVIFIVAGGAIVRGFLGQGEDEVVGMAHHMLIVNGSLYTVLGVLFVLRGALQGLGHTVVPTMTGAVELVGRVGAAIVLGASFGYAGVIWGNPLAWLFAVVLLVPAYLHARRTLGRTPVSATEPVLVEGPAEGPLVVEAVVPMPRCVADPSTSPQPPVRRRRRLLHSSVVAPVRRRGRRRTRA
ncbi:MATE family efflux transporter [Cellulomonas sp. McL0617]|uniref:MATE family efflux transporter n=1 Tax=Cellulomonas sp. McL0617 TaxID=3415675 RepID=UPI003CF4957A